MTPEGLVVSLREVVFFIAVKWSCSSYGQATLARIATILGGKGFEIRGEGHTDNVPIHTAEFKSSWELSRARATQVVALLSEKYSFDPLLISAAGYSEYRPVNSNDTPQGRAANRRVDLVVVGRSVDKNNVATTETNPTGAELKSNKPAPSILSAAN